MEERWTEGWPERQTEGQTDPSVMDRRTDGRMEGWTDPIFLDPSGYCRGSNNKHIHYRTNSVTIKGQIFL